MRFLLEWIRFVLELFVLFTEGVYFLAELSDLLLLLADRLDQLGFIDAQQRIVDQCNKIVDNF